ncbi:unnamed protein product [Meloidogyne enterolobii]|uniref:Uncharacterized protein n=1 Tax=Meloidogyne enterolobii TaxID=390850 RepID=A0ACB1B293_MELEN
MNMICVVKEMQKMYYDYVRNYHITRVNKKWAKMDKVPIEKSAKSEKM